MDKNKLIRKLYAYRKDPDLYKAPSNDDLADLVILVLNAVRSIAGAEKHIEAIRKYDAEAKKVLTNAEQESRKLLAAVQTEVNRLIAQSNSVLIAPQAQLESRVQQALDNIRDGKNGIVTDAEIERAAAMAASLIQLPDIDALIGESITANPEAVRNALELLSGDARYKVEVADVRGLEEKLKQLEAIRATGGGTIGKNQVYGFIREAIADGTITTSTDIAYQATAPSSPSDGDLWIDTSEVLNAPVRSGDIATIVALTQAAYDALGSYDSTTLYYIID